MLELKFSTGLVIVSKNQNLTLKSLIEKEFNNKLTNKAKANYFSPKENLAIYLMVHMYIQNSVQFDKSAHSVQSYTEGYTIILETKG